MNPDRAITGLLLAVIIAVLFLVGSRLRNRGHHG